MWKPAKFAIILLTAGLSLLSAWPAAAKTTLRVGYLPILDHLVLLVSHAHDQASFKEVAVEPKLFKSWEELGSALQIGGIDAAFMLAPLALDIYGQRGDTRAILLAHRDGSAITVKASSEIRSAADLRGKSVAIPAWKSTHTALLDKYLRDGGLSLKEIKPKVIAPPNMIEAMEAGRIDGFIVAEPFGSIATLGGNGRLLVLSKEILPQHIDCIVVVKQNVLREKQAALAEWVASLIKAGQWIEQDMTQNGALGVAKLTAKTYLPHAETVIAAGLQNPVDRISFDHLEPQLEDFRKIQEISVQAGILKPAEMDAFIEPALYRQALAQ